MQQCCPGNRLWEHHVCHSLAWLSSGLILIFDPCRQVNQRRQLTTRHGPSKSCSASSENEGMISLAQWRRRTWFLRSLQLQPWGQKGPAQMPLQDFVSIQLQDTSPILRQTFTGTATAGHFVMPAQENGTLWTQAANNTLSGLNPLETIRTKQRQTSGAAIRGQLFSTCVSSCTLLRIQLLFRGNQP